MLIDAVKKVIPIETYLSKKGYQPVTSKGDFLHYHSPLRDDRRPSFWVNVRTQKFGDFADNTAKGDLIDLVKMIEGHKSQSETLYYLEMAFRCGAFSSARPVTRPKPKQTSLEIQHTQSLQNKALVQYLYSRKINADNAKAHGVSEAYYTIKPEQTEPYFALMFPNDKGGCELRSQYFKGGTSPKGITTIKQQSDTAVIFEGFMDYLSAEEYWHSKTGQYIPYDIFILNSIVNRPYADLKPYAHIKCFLDNDFDKPVNNGLECFNAIKAEYPQAQNLSSVLYPDSKDFNEYWQKISQ